MPAAERVERGIMIDAPDTDDRDDAIWVEAATTGFEASVHIALVSDQFGAHSGTDQQARKRIHSKYLPHTTVGMLPKEIEQAASLRHGAQQPTLRVDLSFAPDGEMLGCTVDRGTLRDSSAISYSAAAHILTTPEGRTDPLHPVLSAANGLASVLLNRRQQRGALAFYDVFKGWATNEEGHLIRLGRDQRNTGYIIVQELMIAANSAIATWCGQHDIPILFRNHRLATVAGDADDIRTELATMENLADPAGYEMMRKRMSVVQRPATYAPVVFGHHGLSLPAYTHTTSPLRRYSDLVNQRILLAHIDQQPVPYDFAQLEELAEDLNTRIQAERQRRAEKHRRQARQTTREQLSEADFDTLDAIQFAKVLRLALRQEDPAANLVAEARRRFENDSLPLRDGCEILFRGDNPAWALLRESINRHLAEESGRALTVLSMYAQAIMGGPIGNEQLRWHEQSVGNARQPCFEARLELELGDQRHISPARRQPSKKEAKAQAALALVAQIAGVEDLSRDDEVPIDITPQRRERVSADHHPVMAINQYAQIGTVRDVTWSYDRSGPPHMPTFTCTVSATVLDESDPIKVSGSGNSKQLAKAAAADRLWADVDERLNVAENSQT